ncbi:MAG: S46 family peptidase [Planctomycetota bacterium]
MTLRFLPLTALALALSAPLATAQSAETRAAGTPGADDHLAMGKMWTFENPPLAYLEQEYGFKPDQAWLDSLRLGALRLGERDNPWCSASFVSPKGLIMTNHHCVRDKVAELGMATGNPNLVEEGYAARELGDERQLEGLTVHQLVRQEDVTERVNAGVEPGDDAQAIAKKRAANIEAIQAAADRDAGELMHQVVTLYQGAVHQLYSYKVYDDIRLVLAVNLQAAHFGGDPDNFTYPRWSIDFSFVRAYENGEPADTTAYYFKWRKFGATDGELVFVPGNPGSTNRLFTMDQLEYQRDVEYPLIVEQLGNGMKLLAPFTEGNPGLHTTLLGWENSYKAVSGMLGGLCDDALMAKKQGHEERFRGAVMADPKLAEAYGSAWGELETLAAQKRTAHPRSMFYNPSYSAVIERAVAVARAVDANLDDEQRAAARGEAEGMRMYGNPLTQLLLVDHFQRAENWLALGDPYLDAVAGDQVGADVIDWAEALQELGKSKLRGKDFVTELLDGGADAVAASDDPGVRVGRVLWPLMHAAEEREQELDRAIEVQGARLGKALHGVFGTKVSPDATMTLRFSDGLVKGYEYNGTLAPWATTFYGLYGRSFEFGGEFPFALAAPWQAARDRIDLGKRVCFASTNDIVGGNSGSCVVDRDLQVVGLIFDGNIESLPNDFYYTQEVARAVSVHTDAIVEALEKVYDMGRVLDELRSGAAKARDAAADTGGGR